jgi:hypothetical protein
MTDPVFLPTSKNHNQRSTIQQQLLNNPLDPWNRQPLTIDMVEEAPELKAKVVAWMQEVKSREDYEENLAIWISNQN